jgi:hypothetical protein
MRVDEVEASWDAARKSWLLRIRIGEEVIRRHCDAARNADDGTLKSLAQKTLQDEGFDPEPAGLKILR